MYMCVCVFYIHTLYTKHTTHTTHSNVVIIATGATSLRNLTDPYKVDYEVRMCIVGVCVGGWVGVSVCTWGVCVLYVYM